MFFILRVNNEGHAADGSLVCKVGVNDIPEAERIFAWVASKDEILDAGTFTVGTAGAPYIRVGGWVLYPQGVNAPVLEYADWANRSVERDDTCPWWVAVQVFDAREAIMYFDVRFGEYNLEEDEAEVTCDADVGEFATLGDWRTLLAAYTISWPNDPQSGAALAAEWAGVRYVQCELTKLFQQKED